MEIKKRLTVYTFYDKDGIADRYVDFFLEGLKAVSTKIIIVSNGPITKETRDIFKRYSDDIIIRENKGFDIWGYKVALEYEGWDSIVDYYEVVLVNNTLMGPVYPFSEMFDKMSENAELDFWGMTRHCQIDFDPFKCNPFGYIPEHIQSSFVVFRNKFLKTRELKQYWDNLPSLNSYEEAVGKHETFFTKHFSDSGFYWDTYVNNIEESKYTDYYLMLAPKKAIKKDRCPAFKRRSFFQNQDYFLNQTMGEQSLELFQYLKDDTDYDTDMVLENLIRTCNQADIVRTLGLYYVLPSKTSLTEKLLKDKMALIMHVYYLDILDDTLHYASSMPANADIYINTPHVGNVKEIEQFFAALPNKVTVQVIENRGRDVSSLLVASADIIDKYEYICFYHDKKVTQVSPMSVGRSFSYLTSESALHSKKYVENIIATFNANSRLGLLTNIPPHNGAYHDTLGREWGPNFDNTARLAKSLGLNVPLSKEIPPIAPLGTVFWFRTAAMKKLFDVGWQYVDFPPEPNGIDGSFLHAVERVYSYVVQDAGYYPAYVMPDFLAGIQMADFIHYTRESNKVMYSNGISGAHYYKTKMLNDILAGGTSITSIQRNTTLNNKTKIKLIIKKTLPHNIYKLILKGKRYVFGPRNMSVNDDD